MASACALAIFSGTVLFIFRVCHALRAAPNAFSREGGAAANCICWRWLPAGASRQRRERAALRGAPPLRCFATPAVPLLALRATSPGRGSLSRRGLSPSQSNPSGLPALPKGELVLFQRDPMFKTENQLRFQNGASIIKLETLRCFVLTRKMIWENLCHLS